MILSQFNIVTNPVEKWKKKFGRTDRPPNFWNFLVGDDALIGPKAFVLLCSCTERRCAERRDLSGGRVWRDGQLMAGIF